MLLPAAGITLNGWSIRVRLAVYFHPLSTTAAINAKFSFTRRDRAWLVWMAWYHTLMSTLGLLLEASLSTALLLKFLNTVKATTRKMTNFLALMTALKKRFAHLTTVWCTFVAKYISHKFFATIAKAGHILETGRTIS